MKIIALITAKGSNTSIPDKNIIKVCGKSALYYPINAAKKSRYVKDIFVSTEDRKIKKAALKYNVKLIDRPKRLARRDTNHGDVITHAAEFIKNNYYQDLGIVVVLLGNSVMVDAKVIDSCINVLLRNKEVSSSMTVWRAQDDHPYRAMTINKKGFLKSFLKGVKPDTNRQCYPVVYYYDQGPWVVRYATIEKSKTKRKGPGPWWWMGKNCKGIERPWVTGRDFHSRLDLWISKQWIKCGVKNEKNFY